MKKDCDCCGRSTDDKDLVVCSSLLAPCSISYCKECRNNNAEASWLIDAFITTNGYNLSSTITDYYTVFVNDQYILIKDHLNGLLPTITK